MLLYADDTALLSEIVEELQGAIEIDSNTFKRFDLTTATVKTKTIILNLPYLI